MINKKSRSEVRAKKHRRLRNRISGTASTPRLAVFRSNNHMYAQIIDDTFSLVRFWFSLFSDFSCVLSNFLFVDSLDSNLVLSV